MKWWLGAVALAPLLLALATLPRPIDLEGYSEVNSMDLESVGIDTSMLVLGSGRGELKMYISSNQALSIEMGLNNLHGPRPSTHDLAASVLQGSGILVRAVTVDQLVEGHYTATMHARTLLFDRRFDCRPSDCVALGVRLGAPIYVKDSLFESEVEEPEDIIRA